MARRLTDNGIHGVHEIEDVEDRWYDPNAEYSRVRTPETKRYILRYVSVRVSGPY